MRIEPVGSIIAVVVLVLAIVFAAIGKLTIVVAALVAMLALAILLRWSS
jgi:hypothetical protein